MINHSEYLAFLVPTISDKNIDEFIQDRQVELL